MAEDGDYTIEEPLVTIQKKDGSEAVLSHDPEMADPRPQTRKPPLSRLQASDHRAADRGYPVPPGQGRHRRHPGGFGTGKTMMQHQIAKWSDADIIIYTAA